MTPAAFLSRQGKPIIDHGKNMGRLARQDPLAQLAAWGPPKNTERSASLTGLV
jgi:hypothetical protein